MSLADLLLRRFDEEMRDLAEKAMTQPQNRDAFEYGRVHGLYGGLDRARDILLTLIGEENEKDI